MLTLLLIAFGQFFSFFAIIALLVVQLVIFSDSLSARSALNIQRADKAYGIAVVLILVLGIVRVFLLDSDFDYNFSNPFFLLTLAMLVTVGLLSIYSTISYQRWNRALNRGEAPDLSIQSVLRLRRFIHYKLVGIVGSLFFGSLAVGGFGG